MKEVREMTEIEHIKMQIGIKECQVDNLEAELNHLREELEYARIEGDEQD